MPNSFIGSLSSGTEEANFFTSSSSTKSNALTPSSTSGITPLVDVTFVVEGQELIHCLQVELKQSTQTHHEFSASFHPDCLKKRETHEMEESQKLVGKRLLMCFRYKTKKDHPHRYFTGVITHVSFEQSHGTQESLVIKGFSPTILLDQAPHTQSFGGKNQESLALIVQQLLDQGYHQQGRYKSNIQLTQPRHFSYSCQHNETAYNYLFRLAHATGEPFFYDGDVLHFGRIPPNEKPILLHYGRNVNQLEIRLQARQIHRLLYDYNSMRDEKLSASGDTHINLKGSLAKSSYVQSTQTFIAPSLQQAPIKATTHQEVEVAQRALVAQEGIRVFITTGTTTVPFLYPGCTIELHLLEPDKKTGRYFTTLLVTEVHHHVDALGQYHGRFQAVDAQTGYIPQAQAQPPLAEQQLATVVSNNDPDAKGRIQVQFAWQRPDQATAFIRLLSMQAGNSQQVPNNRGIVFIPEEGDQVMVSFIGNHPDRPFVLGSLFYGSTGIGGGQENQIKSLRTRSGHTLRFTEEESIELFDATGNYIKLDTQAKDILITAPENLVLTAANIHLQASENIHAHAQQHLFLEAHENVAIKAAKQYNLTARDSTTSIVYTAMYQTQQYRLTCEIGQLEATKDNFKFLSNKEVETISNRRVKLL
ncbi:type VI secretion system Vgr family protein [Myroides odoratus]